MPAFAYPGSVYSRHSLYWFIPVGLLFPVELPASMISGGRLVITPHHLTTILFLVSQKGSYSTFKFYPNSRVTGIATQHSVPRLGHEDRYTCLNVYILLYYPIIPQTLTP